MNKILLSLLVSGVFFGGVQNASAMEIIDLTTPPSSPGKKRNRSEDQQDSRKVKKQKQDRIKFVLGNGTRSVIVGGRSLHMQFMDSGKQLILSKIIVDGILGVPVIPAIHVIDGSQVIDATQVVDGTVVSRTRSGRIEKSDERKTKKKTAKKKKVFKSDEGAKTPRKKKAAKAQESSKVESDRPYTRTRSKVIPAAEVSLDIESDSAETVSSRTRSIEVKTQATVIRLKRRNEVKTQAPVIRLKRRKISSAVTVDSDKTISRRIINNTQTPQ